MKLDGKRVLLTGASSGIGRELALEVARHRAVLAIVARREQQLNELADEIAASGSSRPHVLVTDLSVPEAAVDLAARAETALGSVDILINNAGVAIGGPQWLIGDSDGGRAVFQTNVWSPLALIAALVPAMRTRKSGAVVNVTSMSQIAPWVGLGHYSASKAALASFTDTLRLELQGSGVHVLEVIPGPTETGMQSEARMLPGFEKATTRFGTVGDPAVLARLAVKALVRERSRMVYPRSQRPAYLAPAVLRAAIPQVSRAMKASANLEDRVALGGSSGDADVVAVRKEWEAKHR